MTVVNKLKEDDKKKPFCSQDTLKKRLPIVKWLPNYSIDFFIQDMVAGVTVGLTAIAQGIAYAFVAGLPPEYGLYASLTAGIVYTFFGSCAYLTVGPTAIISTLTARYVAGYSPDFAVLAAFLSGIVVLLMGFLNLGFLVEFISMPVIKGFTNAGALQIASSQLRSFFGLSGLSGNYFAESLYYFFVNIKTVKLWESVLGVCTIIMLALLKKMGEDCNRSDGFLKQMRWFFSLSRNAVVVIIGMIIAFGLQAGTGSEPLAIIGEIGKGLPEFSLPPFTTVVGNETYTFPDMLRSLGPQSLVLPLIMIIESVAIAKAFSNGATIDATQEMIALGLCNIIGSFGQSMPITGSFARTALNHFSGVKTPMAGVANVTLIIVALTLLTSTFRFIPKASLAGLIIFAMYSMLDFTIIGKLWSNSKREFFLHVLTMIVCLFSGIEYGIVTGIFVEAILLLYRTARPSLDVTIIKCAKADLLVIPIYDSISYCAAEHVRRIVLKASLHGSLIIIDGTNLKTMDFTVASNLMSYLKDLERRSIKLLCMNFDADLKNMCVDIDPKSETKFVYAADITELANLISKEV